MITKGEYIAQRHVNSDMMGIHFDIDRSVDPNTIRNISCGLTQDEAEFIVSACNQCKEINPEHPELVAQNIKEMYETLKGIYELSRGYTELPKDFIQNKLDFVLSKIKGGE